MIIKWVKFYLFLLPTVFLLALPRGVLADSTVLDVTKDTYANEAYPDKIYGNYDHLIVSNKFTTRVVYIQFEDLDLPEEAILDKATLNFNINSVNYADSAKVNIGPITGAWEETVVTWNNKPTINQARAIEVAFSLTGVGVREIDVTPLIRQWLEGVENKGFFIYPYGFLYGATETEYAYSFRSKESGTQRANIVVEYHFESTPPPTPTPSPSPTPTSTPTFTLETDLTEESTETAVPEKSPSPTPEPEEPETEDFVLSATANQVIIGGLVLLAFLGGTIALIIYFFRKKLEKKSKDRIKEEKKE